MKIDGDKALGHTGSDESSGRPAMSGTILLVTHSEWREERVAPMLQAKGYAVERRCPARGDRLPDDSTAYAGTIVFGGAQSANDGPTTPYIQHEIDWIGDYVAGGGRYLGICLGGQLLARAFGARVAHHPQGINEIGYYPLRATAAGRTFFPADLHVYHWHQEGFDLPDEADLLAAGDAFPNQAFRLGRHAFGLQFHPEVRPADARVWFEGAAAHLSRPGAQSREQQEAGFVRHDPPLEAWLDGFLSHWLEQDVIRPQTAKACAVERDVSVATGL
jgi:GMP synthase (glutamine-hydrolysing)